MYTTYDLKNINPKAADFLKSVRFAAERSDVDTIEGLCGTATDDVRDAVLLGFPAKSIRAVRAGPYYGRSGDIHAADLSLVGTRPFSVHDPWMRFEFLRASETIRRYSGIGLVLIDDDCIIQKPTIDSRYMASEGYLRFVHVIGRQFQEISVEPVELQVIRGDLAASRDIRWVVKPDVAVPGLWRELVSGR